MRRLFALLLALGLAGCSDLIFHPTRELVLTPDQIGLAYEDVRFEADDGVALHGWFLPAVGDAHGSVLFLHGNAQNISTHIASVAWLPEEGFDVFLFDYRGYGRSEGEPDLDGLHRDFDAALTTLLDRPDVAPERVAVFGQSLGGAVAITGLARSPKRARLAALVVEGGFTGYRALARETLADFWLTWPFQWPLALTIDDRYRPIEAIAELRELPVLIIHGEADQVVPVHHGIALFEAAHEPKTLWLVPGAGHIEALAHEQPRAELARYLRRRFESATGSPRARARRRPRRGRPARVPVAAAAGRPRRSPRARARP